MNEIQEIFVSYDHRDNEYVQKLAAVMERIGLKPRTDFALPYGANFYDFMERAVKECFVGMPIISKHYLKNDSWAAVELKDLIARQVKGHLLLVPIVISEDLALPFALQTVRYLDNKDRDPKTLEPRLKDLKCQLEMAPFSSTEGSSLAIDDKAPPERRIRVQTSVTCNRRPPCPWCHWDEYDRDTIQPAPEKVLKILKNINATKEMEILPRPKVEFSLTGGEPLQNLNLLRRYLAECPPNSYLISNCINLENAIELLNDSSISHLRITYPFDVQDGVTRTTVDKGIHKLIQATKIDVRFNRVLPLNTSDTSSWIGTVEETLEFVTSQWGMHIPDRIQGVAFLEPYYQDEPPHDLTRESELFDVATAWAARLNLRQNKDRSSIRKRSYETSDGLKVQFVKVNCGVKDDYILRCLHCVVDRDICLTADGRIRICSGWNPKTMAPRYSYAHFSETTPLVGISAAILREYGTVGFFGHFPLLIQIATGKNIEGIPEQFSSCRITDSGLAGLLDVSGSHFVKLQDQIEDWTILRRIAKVVMGDKVRFPRLYTEGVYDLEKHENSIKLCAEVLRGTYSLAYILREGEPTRTHYEAFVTALLILEYLTVDESLFSTGRTVLARGVSTELLREWRSSSCMSEGAYADAIFCIGAIAMENVDPEAVRDLVSLLIDGKSNESPAPQIDYVLGCIHRQMNEPEAAADSFRACARKAEIGIRQKKRESSFAWLFPELLAEAQRSLGATLKGIQGAEEECRESFLNADMNSLIYETKLRYNALFSDGYASMRRYFSSGHHAEHKRHALRCFADSLVLAPTFYASLLRVGILEACSDMKPQARRHLKRARETFSEKGLLTDQEFLNSLLCDLALGYAGGSVTTEDIPDPYLQGMNQCTRVGKKDVECVRSDAEILIKNATSPRGELGRTLARRTASFIECCDEIIGAR